MTDHTRRTVLRTAAATGALAAGTLAAAPGAHAAPHGGGHGGHRLPTYVFVHGANSSASGWAPYMRELTLLGHRTLAVDLPGHGPDAYFPAAYQAPQDLEALKTEPSPLGKVTLDDYTDHVVDVVRRARRNGPVILVGQSQGGLTVNRVGNAVPELLDRIAYVAAFCPVKLPTLLDYLKAPEAKDSLAFTIPGIATAPELGITRANWRSGDPDFLAKLKAATAAGYPDVAFRALINTLDPDETAGIAVTDARVDAATWGRIPRTYIRFSEDRMIPPALQDRMIAEADALTPRNRFTVRTVQAPHMGPYRRAPLVSALAELARGIA
ncbi:alpha/beta hydrolase [Streptomyces syringium]|uniref:alpha/beta hydrolase n=1 Tax=Streptomyces syringium TaxID=76729 RepID=UPI0033ED6689